MNSLGITDQVIIYVKEQDSRIIKKYDRNDVCMKVAIASFEVILSNPHGDDLTNGKEPQFVLNLRPFSTSVNYAKEDGTLVDLSDDKEADLAACALESVLKALHKSKCVGKDEILFQIRRGTNNGRKVSPPYFIILNKDKSSALSLKDGIISHAYIYLSERKISLFLNDVSNDTINKIGAVLSGLFSYYNEGGVIKEHDIR
jgi:hypothetical protein